MKHPAAAKRCLGSIRLIRMVILGTLTQNLKKNSKKKKSKHHTSLKEPQLSNPLVTVIEKLSRLNPTIAPSSSMALLSKFTEHQMITALRISTYNKIFLLWQISLWLKTNLDRISFHATYCCTKARASWCLSHKAILQRCSFLTWSRDNSFRR